MLVNNRHRHHVLVGHTKLVFQRNINPQKVAPPTRISRTAPKSRTELTNTKIEILRLVRTRKSQCSHINSIVKQLPYHLLTISKSNERERLYFIRIVLKQSHLLQIDALQKLSPTNTIVPNRVKTTSSLCRLCPPTLTLPAAHESILSHNIKAALPTQSTQKPFTS